MESDFAVVTLPPELAAHYGPRLLVEALAMTGAAVFRGAYRTWNRTGKVYAPGEPVAVAKEHRAALEEAFVEALRLQATDDAVTINDTVSKHAARAWGRGITMSRNPVGMRHFRGFR